MNYDAWCLGIEGCWLDSEFWEEQYLVGSDAGVARAYKEFLSKDISKNQKEENEKTLVDIIKKYGPPVELFPLWHPLNFDIFGVSLFNFVNATLIDEPGRAKNIERYLKSKNLDKNSLYVLNFKPVTLHPYSDKHEITLVTCDWINDKEKPWKKVGQYIPKSVAIPLFLEETLPMYKKINNSGTCFEYWEETLWAKIGSPHFKTHSMFVNHDTVNEMKNIWDILLRSNVIVPRTNGFIAVYDDITDFYKDYTVKKHFSILEKNLKENAS